MDTSTDQKEMAPSQELGFLQVSVLVLSIYVLAAMFVQAIFTLPPNVGLLLDWTDFFVCGVFLTDFFVRFHRAPSKITFMRWGWLDLVSSIPAVDFLRWGRIPRLLRILRMFRAFRSARSLTAFLYRNRTRSLLGTAALTAVILVIFSSIAILSFEDSTESNIKSPFDAVWWAISTMTTVGYGDRYPVTTEGKLVAIVLMVTGVGMFGVITGLFAHIFVERELRNDSAELKALAIEVQQLREMLVQANRGSAIQNQHLHGELRTEVLDHTVACNSLQSEAKR